uniref:Uncharacterized protein n=1 Tax=Chenopodium quinoa TaxID=63459 RepID=A0A803MGK3_CHEQI
MLKTVKEEVEPLAMFSKGNSEGVKGETTCTHCGKFGHVKKKCWYLKGFPSGHPKAQKDFRMNTNRGGFRGGRGNRGGGRIGRGGRTTANVHTEAGSTSNNSSTLPFNANQLEQLVKMWPNVGKLAGTGQEEEDDLDFTYAGMDKKSGEIRGIGKAENGLYYLINEPMQDVIKKLAELKKHSEKVALQATSTMTLLGTVKNVNKLSEPTLWHQRLGHAPMTKIRKIEELKGVEKKCEDVCLTCPAAKFTKLPYSLSESREKHAFELIHIDIWGAYKVVTRCNQKYFLTIVDEFSRVTWVKLLKEKSQAFSGIEEFVHMSKTQYGKKVQVIRSDNALEFDDGSSKKLFRKMGMVHQTSCVDIPQQNGRVERKHRNILEMERALRIQAEIPLQYWGHPLNQKGYKLLNLAENKVFVSRDVKFLESVCPYKLFHPHSKTQTEIIDNTGIQIDNKGIEDNEEIAMEENLELGNIEEIEEDIGDYETVHNDQNDNGDRMRRSSRPHVPPKWHKIM